MLAVPSMATDPFPCEIVHELLMNVHEVHETQNLLFMNFMKLKVHELFFHELHEPKVHEKSSRTFNS